MFAQGFLAASSDNPQDFAEIKVIPFGVTNIKAGERIIQLAICVWSVEKHYKGEAQDSVKRTVVLYLATYFVKGLREVDEFRDRADWDNGIWLYLDWGEVLHYAVFALKQDVEGSDKVFALSQQVFDG